ncbi:glycosyltransferase [Rhodobacteraceae bacterium]|nr:glycosyltransferase [Paracoccaceae bacterium]
MRKNTYRGWVGFSIKQEKIVGWIVDQDAPQSIVDVEVLIDEQVIGRVGANEYREHLTRRNVPDAYHGFSIALPADLPSFDARSISARPVAQPSAVVLADEDHLSKLGKFAQTLAAARIEEPEQGTENNTIVLNAADTSDETDLAAKLRAREDRINELLGFLDNRKAEAEKLKQKAKGAERLERSAKTAVQAASAKMWGGYAKSGQQDLTELANSPMTPSGARAMANYELARFFADTNRPFTGARFMAAARAQSKGFMRGVRPRLLEADLLMASGNPEQALRRLEDYIELRPDDPNYKICMANYHQARGDLAGMMNEFNAVLGLGNLAPVTCDPQAPFLSLHAPQAPADVADGPKVSVLISSYNSAQYLQLAVGSMQAQTWRNIEILVTDDLSTDGSREILQQMAADDPRIKVIENTYTRGTYGNRNAMLEVATGEFVTVHDSDDWSHPEMIERQVRHLMENPDVRLNTTLMCRVSLELRFHLRPARHSLEYCHMNYPGFMMRHDDIMRLGGWDPIMANADAEFERRVKQVYGKEAFVILDPNTVYSLFLVHENSLTQQKKMNLRSLTFGSRNEYHRQSDHWMKTQRAVAEETGDALAPFVLDGRRSATDPFPSPNSLMIPSLKKEVLEYDVLIMSDMTLLGGTRSCNVNYIRTLHAMGRRVAMFNWPRADLRLAHDINGLYRDLKQEGLIDIVTWEDQVKADRVIVHHPPIANVRLDQYPEIETNKVAVLVNQLPFQTTERDRSFYHPAQATELLQEVLGVDDIEWIAISPLTMDYLQEYAGQITLSPEIWYPPHFAQPELIEVDGAERFARMQSFGPRLVRHSRDHWTKWPNSESRTRKMYMADAGLDFTILGGSKTLEKQLPNMPETWSAVPYDGITVPELLTNGDIYLNFNNEVYIEEFGRNVMEALVFGLPVITEEVFARTFGSAVLVAGEEGPAALVERLRTDEAFFLSQVQRGQDFVAENCSTEAVAERMRRFLG